MASAAKPERIIPEPKDDQAQDANAGAGDASSSG
jgi:hypothetical protein